MHAQTYFTEAATIAREIDTSLVESLATELAQLRERGGRLFLIGVGGSAANCSHAVNDFRKLCGIEAYTPVDNVSELTARTNDEGWDTVFAAWLKTSKAEPERRGVRLLGRRRQPGKEREPEHRGGAQGGEAARDMKVFGVVGRDGGYTKQVGDCVIVIPTVDASRVTPHTEAFQAVVWHCLVSHPELQQIATKW